MSGKIAPFKSKVLISSEATVQEASTERLNTEWGQSTKSLMLLDSLAIIPQVLMGHMVK